MKKRDLLDRIRALEALANKTTFQYTGPPALPSSFERIERALNEREHLASMHYTRKIRQHEDGAMRLLRLFAEDVHGGPLDIEAVSVEDYLPDLMCNLLHLAKASKMEPYDSMGSAMRNFEAEQRNAAEEEAESKRAENQSLLWRTGKELLAWMDSGRGVDDPVWATLRKIMKG